MEFRALLTAALCLVAAPAAAVAAAPSAAPAFYSRWLKTDTHQDGKTKFQIVQRFVPIGGTQESYSVGSVTLMEVPKEPGFTVEATQKQIAQAMGFAKWNRRRAGRAYIFEQNWAKQDKFYRVFIQEEADTVKMAVATFRNAYFYTMFGETEIIQRLYMRPAKTRLDWAKDLIAQAASALVREARADGGLGGFNWDIIFGGGSSGNFDPNTLNDFLNALNQFGNQYGPEVTKLNETIQTNWPETNKQIGIANQNWTDSNKNWATTNENMTKYLEFMNSMKPEVEKANQNWADTNKLGRDYLDFMKDMSKPGKVALLAGSAAAGAAIGATAVGLAVQGVTWAVKVVIKSLRGDYKEAKYQAMIKDFYATREGYEKSKLIAHGAEGSLKAFISQFEKMGLMGAPISTIIEHVDAFLDEKNSDLVAAEDEKVALAKKIRAGGDDAAACKIRRGEVISETTRLKRMIGQISMISAELHKIRHPGQLCDQYRQALRDLIAAEMDLDIKRKRLLRDLPAFLKELRRKFEAQVADDKHLNKGKDDKAFDKEMGQNQKVANKVAAEQRQAAIDSFRSTCSALLRDFREEVPSTLEERQSRCQDLFNRVDVKVSALRRQQTAQQKANLSPESYKNLVFQALKSESGELTRGQLALERRMMNELVDPLQKAADLSYTFENTVMTMDDNRQETRKDRRTSSDDDYTSDTELFAKANQSALEFKRQLEGETDFLHSVRTENLTGLHEQLESICVGMGQARKSLDLQDLYNEREKMYDDALEVGKLNGQEPVILGR